MGTVTTTEPSQPTAKATTSNARVKQDASDHAARGEVRKDASGRDDSAAAN